MALQAEAQTIQRTQLLRSLQPQIFRLRVARKSLPEHALRRLRSRQKPPSPGARGLPHHPHTWHRAHACAQAPPPLCRGSLPPQCRARGAGPARPRVEGGGGGDARAAWRGLLREPEEEEQDGAASRQSDYRAPTGPQSEAAANIVLEIE